MSYSWEASVLTVGYPDTLIMASDSVVMTYEMHVCKGYLEVTSLLFGVFFSHNYFNFVLYVFYRWIWAEAMAQPDLENVLGIGGFGYPVSIYIFKFSKI